MIQSTPSSTALAPLGRAFDSSVVGLALEPPRGAEAAADDDPPLLAEKTWFHPVMIRPRCPGSALSTIAIAGTTRGGGANADDPVGALRRAGGRQRPRQDLAARRPSLSDSPTRTA